MGFLTDHVAIVRAELAEHPLDAEGLSERARAVGPPRRWVDSLRGRGPALIAEVKRASPSEGAIANPDPVRQAAAYVAGGAAAVSVLTEPRHFAGSLEDLERVRAAVDVPVLRKDFLVDPVQVAQARAAGADAVLLITAAVDDDELDGLLAEAQRWGMGVLLETHGDHDLERALATETPVIGVNARDLETLAVDVGSALARLRAIPADRVAVLESGVSTPAHVASAVAHGASAVLVGTALMSATDPAEKIRELLGRSVPHDGGEEPSR
jgi:indole-3-glycerol phosphate synthase